MVNYEGWVQEMISRSNKLALLLHLSCSLTHLVYDGNFLLLAQLFIHHIHFWWANHCFSEWYDGFWCAYFNFSKPLKKTVKIMLVAPVTDSVVSTISMMTVMLLFISSNSIQAQDSNTVRLSGQEGFHSYKVQWLSWNIFVPSSHFCSTIFKPQSLIVIHHVWWCLMTIFCTKFGSSQWFCWSKAFKNIYFQPFP